MRVAARLHGIGRRAALQQPDGGGRVRHRARRRAEHAGAGQGRRDPARARRGAARRRPPCTWPCSTASSWPTTRWSRRTSRAADLPRPVRGLRRPLLRPDHHAGAAEPRSGSERRPNSRYASLEQCTYELRAGRGDVPRTTAFPWSTLGHPLGRGDVDRDPAATHPSRGLMSNVVWFAELGLADLEQVGGKNASLGEMIANLAVGRASRVPDGFATTAEAYRRFLGDDRAGRADRRRAAPAWTPTTSRALAEVGQRDPGRGRGAAVPGRPRGRHPGGVRPSSPADDADASFAVRSQRHRRGPARRLVRRSAGDLPQRPRDRRGAAGGPGGLRLALQRPGDRLPGAPRLRPRRRWRCRPACSGWCAPTSAPPG